MKLTFLIMLLLAFFYGNCQEEKESYTKMTNSFIEYYNQEKPEEIFELFSPQMKGALPLSQTSAFISQLTSQVGKIKSKTFKRYQNSYAIYKTEFDQAVLALHISIDADYQINGLFMKPYVEEIAEISRNKTLLQLPFVGTWDVFWGGDTVEQNYHAETKYQRGAFDILIFGENGKSYRTDGTTNEDYIAFGKKIMAPCDAEVVLAVDGVKDNLPGKLNPTFLTGNTVILKTVNNEFILFAHFKQGSVAVKQGQMVKSGELIGLCGNSGNSTEAHLHFHIQNVEELSEATGVKTYFNEINVNGVVKNDYSPVKGDKISNN